jgi:hypothetical protein
MIFSAVGLLASSAVTGVTPIAVPAAAGTDGIIEAFYAGVNDVLQTGSGVALDHAVADDLVVHGLPQGFSSDGQGLIAYLVALRTLAPGRQLEIQKLVASGDQAMAQIAEVGDEPKGFLGFDFASLPPLWGRFHRFLIERGRVVELWVDADELVHFEPRQQVSLDEPLTSARGITLDRLSGRFDGDGTWGPLFEPRVLYVADGALTVALDPASATAQRFSSGTDRVEPRDVAPGARLTLTAGDAIALPAGARYAFHQHVDRQDVVAFVVSIPQSGYDGPLQPQSTPRTASDVPPPAGRGDALTSLVAVPMSSAPRGLQTVSFGQMTLPPGSTVALRGSPGVLFVNTMDGTLVLDRGDTMTRTTRGGFERLPPGRAALVPPGTSAAMHNLSEIPATALVITMR